MSVAALGAVDTYGGRAGEAGEASRESGGRRRRAEPLLVEDALWLVVLGDVAVRAVLDLARLTPAADRHSGHVVLVKKLA